MLRKYRSSFENPGQFDADACLAEADALALELLSAHAVHRENRRASDETFLEDRAFTLLESLLDELRRALEYAWIDDPDRVSDVFKPAMGRRRKARYPKKEQE